MDEWIVGLMKTASEALSWKRRPQSAIFLSVTVFSIVPLELLLDVRDEIIGLAQAHDPEVFARDRTRFRI